MESPPRTGGAAETPRSARGDPPDHGRLPAATRPGAVRLQVSELQRSLEWYEGVLGFEVRTRHPGAASLVAQGGAQPLIELRERAGAHPVPRRGRLGLYHFAILLPDRGALGRFLAHLARGGVTPGMADHLVSEALYLGDPDGLGIEVYADRPRDSWREQGGELAMDTLPLDVPDLLRAGGESRAASPAHTGGREWRMPPGTRIGHVHLHVGDLVRAEAFYQDALGLDPVVRSYPGALFLSAGGYHHHLGVNTWAAGAVPAGEEDARLLEWELVVPKPEDAAAAAERLAAAGHDVADTEDGFRAADPWGTVLRVRSAAPA